MIDHFFLPEVWWRFEHVDGRDLQGDGLQFRQEVEVHEVLVTKEASALSTSVDCRSFDDQLDLWNIRFSVHPSSNLYYKQSTNKRKVVN